MPDFEELSPETKNQLIAARDEGWAIMRNHAEQLAPLIEKYGQLAACTDSEDEAAEFTFIEAALSCIRGELKYRELTGNID